MMTQDSVVTSRDRVEEFDRVASRDVTRNRNLDDRGCGTLVFGDHRQGPFDHIVARYAAGHQAVPENLGLFLHLGHVSSAVSNVEWMSCEPLRYHDNRQCRWVCSIRWFSAQVPRAAPNSCSRACSVVYMYTLRMRRYGGMT